MHPWTPSSGALAATSQIRHNSVQGDVPQAAEGQKADDDDENAGKPAIFQHQIDLADGAEFKRREIQGLIPFSIPDRLVTFITFL